MIKIWNGRNRREKENGRKKERVREIKKEKGRRIKDKIEEEEVKKMKENRKMKIKGKDRWRKTIRNKNNTRQEWKKRIVVTEKEGVKGWYKEWKQEERRRKIKGIKNEYR